MEHAGQLLGRDLVHIGDHQQQTLRGGVGGGQYARAQRAVYRTGSTRLGLHFNDLDLRAEDVLQTVGTPLIHEVRHGAGRRDGVDGRNLGKRIGNMCRRVVAIHGLHLSYHTNKPPYNMFFHMEKRAKALSLRNIRHGHSSTKKQRCKPNFRDLQYRNTFLARCTKILTAGGGAFAVMTRGLSPPCTWRGEIFAKTTVHRRGFVLQCKML